jgi:hypothetical protein
MINNILIYKRGSKDKRVKYSGIGLDDVLDTKSSGEEI